MLFPLLKPIRLWLMLMALACFQHANATHIVGGDLGYQYLGETAPGTGEYRYKLILRLFVNCGPSSSFPSVIDILGSESTGLPVGVYPDDPANPNANKQLMQTAYLYVTSYGVITPNLPAGCNVGDGQCVEESRLEGEVILPASTTGFHIYLQLYARNEAIINLVDPGDSGMGFYSYIPPTSIPNSSPVFTGTPVPYICIADTVAFSNAAVDSDGDSLVFSFRTPYESQDQIGGIAPPPAILNWPLQPVQYMPGLSATVPFGSTGFASIDPVTGATQYYAPSIGNWVVAVEVQEFRNGQLIGLIRSDLQLLSVPCSGANVAPIPLNGELTTTYQVVAGEQLCFPLNFTDADGDLVTLDVVGGIFQPNLISPAAVINGATAADSLLATQFCWATACDQGSPEPYHFSVLVYDDACPPGVFTSTISVEVVPSSTPPTISGLGIGCAGQTTAEYCTEDLENASYTWTVSGGTVLSATDGNCITIAWGDPGIGQITVERTLDSCVMQTVQPINILEASPASFTITTDTTCLGLLVRATDTSPNAASSVWSVNGTPAQNGSEFTIPYAGSSTIGLETTANTGCTSYTEQVFSVGPYNQLVHFVLPNVFTPNNDQINDRFKLITTQSLDACFQVHIYDRWGNLVHESNGGNNGWNGKLENGEPASEGVYYYIVNVNDDTFNGHVSLMR